jgi:dUTP pyrophosphatase
MFINNLNDSMNLEVYRCKKVKLPTRAWQAAGWDLFVPENLSIFDFIKSYKNYLDESVIYSKENNYVIPLIFYMTSPSTIGEFKCRLVLTWNNNINEWSFNIEEVLDDETEHMKKYISFLDISDDIIKWLSEDTTTISKIEIAPHAKINIPSGIHVNLPENVYLKIENKSGIASKRGLAFLASVIDSDYQGEIHINVVNTSNLPVFINAGEKIVQALPMFQPLMKEVVESSSLNALYKDKNSDRGAGGFGSSGEK